MAEAGKIPINPHGGSFVSQGLIKDRIDATKAEKAVNTAQTDAEKAKGDEAEKKRLDEINRLLPDRVASSMGEMSFSTFKSVYKDIWEQVENKDHLARGFCTFERELAPGLKVGLRTFRSGELRQIRRFTSATLPTQDFHKYLDEEYRYRTARLIVGVTSYAGNEMPAVPLEFPEGSVEKWLAMNDVKTRAAWLDALPDEIVEAMSGTLSDVALAYRLALTENLKNRFAPL